MIEYYTAAVLVTRLNGKHVFRASIYHSTRVDEGRREKSSRDKCERHEPSWGGGGRGACYCDPRSELLGGREKKGEDITW